MRPEGLRQGKIPVTPSEIEPATFRLVVQCLSQRRHRDYCTVNLIKYNIPKLFLFVVIFQTFTSKTLQLMKANTSLNPTKQTHVFNVNTHTRSAGKVDNVLSELCVM